MNRREHTLQTARRTFTATIVEESKRIVFSITASAYGQFGDEAEMRTWLAGLLGRYDRDWRSVVIENQLSNVAEGNVAAHATKIVDAEAFSALK